MIEVRRATKYYKDHIALEGINLVINTGDVIGILGDNGAGKTTLLKAIANLISLNTGEVLVDGKPVTGEVYNKLSFITEEGSFFPYLTPMEHEEFLEANFKGFDGARFNKLLDFFKIERNRKLDSFSKGQKAKFEVACGFSKGAKYILMDEPFLGKDIFTRRDFLKLMIAGMAEEETIIIATHHIDEIENFLTRAVILKYGRIREDVSMEKLRETGSTLTRVMGDVFDYNESRIFDILDD